MSPEQKRANDAARQARHRAKVRKQRAVDAAVDYSVGLGPKPTVPPPPMSTDDFNTMVRDRLAHIVNGLDDGEMLNKDYAPAIALGLKAQKALDEREKVKAKTGQTLELLAGLRAILTGSVVAPPLQLDDGNTIEGEAFEVDG